VEILARSVAISSSDASVKSRIACQRIEGSESSSHWIADLSGFGVCHVGGLVVICWFSYYAVDGLTVCVTGGWREQGSEWESFKAQMKA
jgi:hypothetical protein